VAVVDLTHLPVFPVVEREPLVVVVPEVLITTLSTETEMLAEPEQPAVVAVAVEVQAEETQPLPAVMVAQVEPAYFIFIGNR
jgi:hypothetical protein